MAPHKMRGGAFAPNTPSWIRHCELHYKNSVKARQHVQSNYSLFKLIITQSRYSDKELEKRGCKCNYNMLSRKNLQKIFTSIVVIHVHIISFSLAIIAATLFLPPIFNFNKLLM